ncbi:MAG: VCBS repeat-containing protein [Acidobacteriota bacterium]
MPLKYSPSAERRRKFLAGSTSLVFIALITIGVFAKNDWLPSTDHLTGKKTGWFGSAEIAQSPDGWWESAWNPLAPVPVAPTPQLSKEYIYAGPRLLAVEDANANAAPPADLAVWRPSTGTWWVMGGSNSAQVTQSWGTTGDKPVPGDYDGDGKTDFSIFRPSTGQWFVLQSSDFAWAPVFAWGTPTDFRVPADYDGDGRTDRAVWRPSDGTWYIVRSSDQASFYQAYGMNGDVPAPADYDGDGRADIAVWRNSDQKFYSINSSNGAMSVVTVPQPSSQPVSSDYDGDGKADHAVRNGANWTIRQSSNGQTITTSWQQASDISVQNDYDGDGKTDIAVWRDSNGYWYIRQSGSGNSLRQVQWGITGDIPVPAFYRR